MAADWLEDLAEFGPEIVAAACREWRRKPGGKRPTPGDIRALCIAQRQDYGEMLAIEDARSPWPKWLESVWGPEPEGPQRRAEALGAVPPETRTAAAPVPTSVRAVVKRATRRLPELPPFHLLDEDDPRVAEIMGRGMMAEEEMSGCRR